MDAAAFRVLYPEFANVVKYPDPTVTAWITTAGVLLLADVWGPLLDIGTGMYVAHQLAVMARNAQASAAGGVPGQVTGALSSKSVDKVSAGYSAAGVIIEGAGYWNLTTYGIAFFQLANLVGMQSAQQINTPGTTYTYGGGYLS